ncbi:hypothetical protein [Hydrogenophaga soli]
MSTAGCPFGVPGPGLTRPGRGGGLWRVLWAALGLGVGAAPWGAFAQGVEASGQVQAQWQRRVGTTLQAELKASAHTGPLGWHGTLTLQQQQPTGQPSQTHAWVNEAVVSAAAGGLQWSAGKKVVSWDVGYAFRPNDVVQQEVRRTLAPATLVGRPLVMAEHFDASTAWSAVWVNPTKPRTATGADEPALALRVYHRAGEVDWHGFARVGVRTGGSVGAAASWVADDALELHASLRHVQHHDVNGVVGSPSTLGGRGAQALVGGTWTGPEQVSLLVEAWHDGLLTQSPFSAPRRNLYARLSGTSGAWQPALDVLYHPADGGRVWTASLVWQGDRVKWEGGARLNAGPTRAWVRHAPLRQQVYLMGTWSF